MHNDYEINPPREFRLCQRCERPTPAQLPDCVNCGARSLQAVVASDLARAEQRFAQAYFSRTTPLTFAILLLNILVYVAMTLVGGGDFFERLIYGVDGATLIAFGAKTNELLAERGEWFRLVTPIFIHGGLVHILSNSYALWIVGPQVERLYGSTRFVLIYLLSGVGGVIGSYLSGVLLSRPPSIPSVGASGAIFGLFGVLAVFGYKYRNDLPPAFRRAFGSGVFPVIAINLFIGFSIPVIDNGAHLGGLIAGGILALFIPYIAPGEERVSRAGIIVLALCLAVVGYCFARAWRESPPYLGQRESVLNDVFVFVRSLQAVERVMGDGAQRMQPERLEEVAAQLDATRAPDKRSDEIRRELSRILRARAAALRESSPLVREAKLATTVEDFGRARRGLQKWIAEEGKKFGFILSESEADGSAR